MHTRIQSMDGEDPSRQSDFVAIRSKQSNTLCANYLQIHPRLIHLVGSAVQVQRAAKCRKQVPVSLVKRRYWIWKKAGKDLWLKFSPKK